MFADVAVATGWPLEYIGGLTAVQLQAIQKGIIRSLQRVFGGGEQTVSREVQTELFEKKVREMKKATGREVLSSREVF